LKISIITPSYNQGIFIKETIESVLKQDITDFEYIVIDGGSSDETLDILRSYKDKIKWVSETDRGQTDAVNKGIKMSSGEIIGWLNSDDIYYEGTLRKILGIFHKNPEVNILYGQADHIDHNGNYIEDYCTEEWNYEKLKDFCYICQPAVFFRKNMVDKYGYFDMELKYCMDYEYWLRAGKHEKFYFLKEKLAASRLYDKNKTSEDRRKVHEEILEMQKKNLGHIRKRWIYNLAHVIADEEVGRVGVPLANYDYIICMVKNSFFLFLKHYHYVPLKEIFNMFMWVRKAGRKIRK